MREMAFSVCVRFGLVLRSPSPFSGLPIPSGSRVRISPSTAGPRRRPGSALNIFMTEEAPSVSDGGKKNDVSVSNEKDVSTSKSIDSIMESSSNSEDAANPNQPKPQYSLRTRLREETEAPFRKARMFVYGGSAVSAGVGAFIATLRIISALFGTSGVQPLNETIPNVAVNLTVVALCAALLRFENKAGERRLERMSRGARIASLRIEDSVTRQIVRLKDLRGKTRVVLVAGASDNVVETMKSAEPLKDNLSKSNLLIVPFISGEDENVNVRNWRMQSYGKDEWSRWYESEREVAKARLSGKPDDVLVVIVRLDGKVGARSVGVPMWPKLIEEIAGLPQRDQYGKP